MSDKYKIICSGDNVTRFINLCKSENINLMNIKKNSFKEIEFCVNVDDYKKLKTLNLTGYTLTMQNIVGLKKFKKNFVSRLGVFIGILLSVALIVVSSGRLINVNIIGFDDLFSIF